MTDRHFIAILSKNDIARELKSDKPDLKFIKYCLLDIEKYIGTGNQPSIKDITNCIDPVRVCKRCSNSWWIRQVSKPKKCPGCGSPNWNRDDVRKYKKSKWKTTLKINLLNSSKRV